MQRQRYLLEELGYAELAGDLFHKAKEADILFREALWEVGKESKDCEYNAKWKIIAK